MPSTLCTVQSIHQGKFINELKCCSLAGSRSPCLWPPQAPLAPGLGLVSLPWPEPHLTPGLTSLSHSSHQPGTAQSNPIPGPAPCTHSATQAASQTFGCQTSGIIPRPRGYLHPPPGQAVQADDGLAAVRGSVRRVQASNRCLLTPLSPLNSWRGTSHSGLR